MRRVIRKYDDFLRSKSIREDIDPMTTPEMEEIDQQEGNERTEEVEDRDSSNLIDSEEDVANGPEEEGSEEEESGEYEGTKLLNKLAEMLGTNVENNEIDYKGQKINFYSEDEKFHINGSSRNKFKTPEEVVDFLQGSEGSVEESKKFERRRRR